MRHLIICTVVLWITSMSLSWGQGGDSTAYFEGSLSYKVEISGKDSEIINANKPNTDMTMYVKDASYIIHLTKGAYPKTFVFVSDSNYEYSFDAKNKIAYRSTTYKFYRPKERPIAMPTGNTATIYGVECEEYRMNTKKGETFIFYINEKYKVNTKLYEKKFRAKAYFLIQGLDGCIPLKIIKKTKGLVITNTIKKIKESTYKDSQFQIPPNFEIKKRDYRW